MSQNQEKAAELIRQGVQCGRTLDLERGIVFLVDGLRLLNPRDDPRLTLSACHNLALYCARLELPILARIVLDRSERLYSRARDPIMSARRLWLEGTVDALQGDRAEALEKLLEVESRFRELKDIRQVELVRLEIDELEEKQAVPSSSDDSDG